MFWFGLSIVLMVLAAVTTPGQADDDYAAALSGGRTAGKPVILFFFSKNCPYCDLMEKETFRDSQILSSINETAFLAKIDAEQRRDLSRLYMVHAYPTTWLIDEKGSRIGQVPGYISRKDFQGILSYLKGRHYRSAGIKEYLTKKR
jgi:thioredoxin-related protein